MKMVKSLLLGSAAGVVAVAGAQAADLPVKAKPVEYVKVCSLYGAGFFYIPGTDKCIKLGGYVRSQYDIHGAGDNLSYISDANARGTRTDTNDSSFRHRALFSVDAREQTTYGTVRAYMAFGGQQTAPTDSTALFFNRAFIQFAGITTGRAVSFFDFLSYDPYSLSNSRNLASTGAAGINVAAYTANLGNGASFTVSAEDGCAAGPAGAVTGNGRACQVVNTTVTGAMGVGSFTVDNQGYNIPDIVAAARVDQAWGSAQVMGAYHRVAMGYYSTSTTFNQNNGHAGDKAGWAVGGGFLLKDFAGMKGDTFAVEAHYGVGATGYVTSRGGAWQRFSTGTGGFGNSVGFGTVTDALVTSGSSGAACGVVAGATLAGVTCGSSIELTRAWTVGGVYEHTWNPQWKTSIYGGYTKILYSDTAANYYCNGSFNSAFVRGGAASSPTLNASVSSCDPNFGFLWVGTRTMWNPNSNLDLGVDVTYTRLYTANGGTLSSSAAFGARPSGLFAINNQEVLSFAARAQYNFLP